MTLINMFDESVKNYPDNIAIVFEDKRITYNQLWQKVNNLASSLKNVEIKKGDKIAIIMENSSEYIISLFAILKIGAVVVPINHFLTEHEIKFILEDSKVSLIFACPSGYEKVKNIITQNDFIQYGIISEKNISSNKNLFFDDLLNPNNNQNSLNDPTIVENDLAYIIYTSGTTGHPKGAMLTHKNLVSNVEGSLVACGEVTQKDKIIIILPMFHTFTNTVCILLPIKAGARIVIARSIKPFSKVLKLILIERITIFVGIPRVFSVLADHNLPWFFKFINPIRICISGAAPLPGEVLKKFETVLKIPLLEGYGLTEASPVVSFNPLSGKRKAYSIGIPLKNLEVKIVNDNNEELPDYKIIENQSAEDKQKSLNASIGEIIVKGPNVMLGYYNNEIATAEAIKNNWLYTGDVGYKDSDGYIYIVDRKKDMILVHGLNVYPREIEEILYKYPSIKEAAVIGIKHEHHGEIPKAFIVLNDGKTATEKELKEFCKKFLANYKIPHYFTFINDLPKTGTGKISKKDLRKL